MCSVIVKGKRCDIAQRTAAPLSAVVLHEGHQQCSPATKGLVKEWSRSPVIGAEVIRRKGAAAAAAARGRTPFINGDQRYSLKGIKY